LISVVLLGFLFAGAAGASQAPAPVPLLDVPYLSQSEALCGGAAAAMVLRYWGARGVTAETFAHLVDRSAAGIRTDVLAADIALRGWEPRAARGSEAHAREQLALGRPLIALIEDRPGTFHYVVLVAWHDRGVVLHDPARAPFQVMRRDEFLARWRPADFWTLVVVPSGGQIPPPAVETGIGGQTVREGAGSDANCGRLVDDGVRSAQAGDLGAAERSLGAALGCPGAAASRELAGVRLLQRRWPEVAALATAAVEADPADAHAWKLLGTSLFVQNDPTGALEAWNHAGEPRVDLIRIAGVRRTRHRVVEQTIGLDVGEVLTPDALVRARRRLLALPAASGARLDFIPVPSGLAEVRATVAERRVLPAGPLAYVTFGLSALVTREVRLSSGSPTGGGERISAAWRFWPDRPRVAVDVHAPAPWGGTWGLDADAERQPFDTPGFPSAERRAARLALSDWATGTLRWEAHAGVERWEDAGAFGLLGAAVTFRSASDAAAATASVSRWAGDRGFGAVQAAATVRSRSEREGVVLQAAGTLVRVSGSTPLDAWPAGDTGHARRALLRAHPVLDGGRLRVARLGRSLLGGSAEAQHWWRGPGPFRTAGAIFVDAARTADRLGAPALHDADVGIGARFAVVGLAGSFRVDLAKGLRDGATAVSIAYIP
jgi:hypothetical protein